MTRDELEEALADSFDPAALAIYGDYLQSEGDPRGELIALDLHGDGGARRDELVVAWLGEPLANLIHPASIDCGFVADLCLDEEHGSELLDALADSSAEEYLRGVTLVGETTWLRRATAWLAARPRRWLDRLSIRRTDGEHAIAIDDDLGRDLAGATPRLLALEVWGMRVVGELRHAAVRSLCVTGLNAIGAILGHGRPALPALRLLDLACGDAFEPGATQLDPDRLPAVRRLDLSRNEPGAWPPHYLGATLDPFDALSTMPLRAQLTHVRLPSLRSYRQADRLATAVASMPHAREIAIVRAYAPVAGPRLPERVIEADPWPWLPADRMDLTITVRIGGSNVEVQLAPAVAWFESRIDELDDAVRTAWLRMLSLLERWYLTSDLPGDTLAIVAGSINEPDLEDWQQLGARLQHHAGARITVHVRAQNL